MTLYLPPGSQAYANPDAVRQINHKGKYFNVPGPHTCDPSKPRTPALFQAGTSTAGKEFAATHAEAIFLNGQRPELVRPSVDSIRNTARETGRTGDDIKIVCSSIVVVDETDELAQAKYDKLAEYGDREGALALSSAGGQVTTSANTPKTKISASWRTRPQRSEAWSSTGQKHHHKARCGTRNPSRTISLWAAMARRSLVRQLQSRMSCSDG